MSTTFLDLGAGFLWQEDRVDVGQHASLGDSHTLQEFVELLVIADGKQKVPGHDPLLLVVSSSVSGQFQDLCRKVLHYGSQVNCSSTSSPLRVVPSLQQTVNPTDRKLQSSPCSLRDGLDTFDTAWHDACCKNTSLTLMP